MKTFAKKGERVVLVETTDENRSVWRFRPAIVASCGRKRMTLLDAVSGECLGRDFLPGRFQRSGYQDAQTSFVTRATGDALRAEIVEQFEIVRRFEIAMYDGMVEKNAADNPRFAEEARHQGGRARSRRLLVLSFAHYTEIFKEAGREHRASPSYKNVRAFFDFLNAKLDQERAIQERDVHLSQLSYEEVR